MHFGYYRFGFNPFRRERMLNEMNRQVLDRLRLAADREHLIVDLGCGVGATVRYAASLFPRAQILGLTVVPWQVEKGTRGTVASGCTSAPGCSWQTTRARISRRPRWTAPSPLRARATRRARPRNRSSAKPQGFSGPAAGSWSRMDSASTRNGHSDACLAACMRRSAAVSCFQNSRRSRGFRVPSSSTALKTWRSRTSRGGSAPSALHAPAAVLWFMLKKAVRGKRLGEWRVNNLRGSVLSTLVGMNRFQFGYYLVSATKKATSLGTEVVRR